MAQKAYLVLILLAFLLIAASVAAGVEASSTQSQQAVRSPSGSATSLTSSLTSQSQYSAQNSNGDRISVINVSLSNFSYQYLYFFFTLLVVILFLVYWRNRPTKNIVRAVRQSRMGDKVLVAVAASYLMAIALVVFLLSKIQLSVFNGWSLSNINLSFVGEISIIAILLVSIPFGFLVLIRRNIFRFHKQEEPSSAVATEELKQIFERAGRALSGETGYRSSIIECYRQVLEYFERKGMPQRANLTPREFEEELAKTLGVRSPRLHYMTELFEKARYSNEELMPEEVSRARTSIEKISSDFDNL